MPHRRRLAKHRKITSRPANRIVIALQRTGPDMRARYVVAARTLPTISGNVTLQVRTPSLAAVSFDKEFQQFDLLTPRRIGQPPASLANLHPPHVPQCHGIVGLKKRHPPAVHVANHPAASIPSGRSVTADSEISSRCASSKRSTSVVSAASRPHLPGCGRGTPKSRNPTNRIPAQMLRQGRLYTSFSSCLIPSILPSSSASTLS